MERMVREIPAVQPTVSRSSERKLSIIVYEKTKCLYTIPIWFASIHSRNVVSLAGREPLEVETQVLSSATDWEASMAMTKRVTTFPT